MLVRSTFTTHRMPARQHTTITQVSPVAPLSLSLSGLPLFPLLSRSLSPTSLPLSLSLPLSPLPLSLLFTPRGRDIYSGRDGKQHQVSSAVNLVYFVSRPGVDDDDVGANPSKLVMVAVGAGVCVCVCDCVRVCVSLCSVYAPRFRRFAGATRTPVRRSSWCRA